MGEGGSDGLGPQARLVCGVGKDGDLGVDGTETW